MDVPTLIVYIFLLEYSPFFVYFGTIYIIVLFITRLMNEAEKELF